MSAWIKKKSNAVICINLLSLGTNKASYFISLVELSCEPFCINLLSLGTNKASYFILLVELSYGPFCTNLLSLGTNKASYFILLVELTCEPLLIYPLFALPSGFGCSLAASVCCFNRVRISQIPSQPG